MTDSTLCITFLSFLLADSTPKTNQPSQVRYAYVRQMRDASAPNGYYWTETGRDIKAGDKVVIRPNIKGVVVATGNTSNKTCPTVKVKVGAEDRLVKITSLKFVESEAGSVADSVAFWEEDDYQNLDGFSVADESSSVVSPQQQPPPQQRRVQQQPDDSIQVVSPQLPEIAIQMGRGGGQRGVSPVVKK